MTFEHSIHIHARPAELFALTQDYGRRLEWDPFLRQAALLCEQKDIGVGSRALCTARNGLMMETEYVSFNPPRTTAVKMTAGPWFIAGFAGSWRFEPLADGSTNVMFRYNVRGRPRLLARVLSPLLARFFARDTRRRLEALKRAVEIEGILSGR